MHGCVCGWRRPYAGRGSFPKPRSFLVRHIGTERAVWAHALKVLRGREKPACMGAYVDGIGFVPGAAISPGPAAFYRYSKGVWAHALKVLWGAGGKNPRA